MEIRKQDNIRFNEDIYYTDISSDDMSAVFKARNDWRDKGFKVLGKKVYIPKGIYEYNNSGYIEQVKIKDKWYPVVLFDEITYGDDHYKDDRWEFV